MILICKSGQGVANERMSFYIKTGMNKTFYYLLFILFWPCHAYARQAIYYAGQSYSTNSESIPTLFKYTDSALGKEDVRINLNKQIMEMISNNPKYEFIAHENTDSRKFGKATVLALSIDNEIVSLEKIDGKYKILYELSAQALYFDFYEKQVLGSYPFTLTFVDLFSSQPTNKQVQESVDRFLLRSNNNPLVTEFTKLVNQSEIPQAASKRLRIKSIELSGDAAKWIPRSINPEDQKIIYGHEFSKYISTHLDLPVLPASVGRVIGNEMTAKFSNGDVYSLKIPEEDYAVSFKINWFKKLASAKNNVATVYVFGAGTEVRIYEPLSGKIYFDSPMKLGATKTVPATQENIDDWAAISGVMSQLFDEFAKNIRSPEKEWMKTHLGSDKSKEIKALNKLIGESR